MFPDSNGARGAPLIWKSIFGLKLAFDLVIAGIFYYQNAYMGYFRLSFVVFSVVVFLIANLFYARLTKKRNLLLQLLILDFLVSASYGYIFIGGQFPNHLFIGITALAILMFIKDMRMLIVTGGILVVVYLATMGSIDWIVFGKLNETGYFIACSFIVFAGIVSALLLNTQKARTNALELYAKLRESHEQLKEYSLKAEDWAATRVRVRIAREIHDTVGHKLTALLVQMQMARKLSAVDPERSAQAYLESEVLIRSSLQEVRLSVRAIRDEPIQSTSLNDNLERLAEEFTKFARVRTTFRTEGTPVALPSDLQLTAYRIVQESLTNAQKHGHAKKAEIALTYSEDGFRLRIGNDGELPLELKPGFGLINLRERAREKNGDVSFITDPAEGFAVEVVFPYAHADTESETN